VLVQGEGTHRVADLGVPSTRGHRLGEIGEQALRGELAAVGVALVELDDIGNFVARQGDLGVLANRIEAGLLKIDSDVGVFLLEYFQRALPALALSGCGVLVLENLEGLAIPFCGRPAGGQAHGHRGESSGGAKGTEGLASCERHRSYLSEGAKSSCGGS